LFWAIFRYFFKGQRFPTLTDRFSVGSRRRISTVDGGRTVIDEKSTGVEPLASGARRPTAGGPSAERSFIFWATAIGLSERRITYQSIELTWPVCPHILYDVLDTLPDEVHPSQD
jgi:hypothetical protein